MTEQTKAEAYVRSQRPALMEISNCRAVAPDKLLPINLHDWLAVLDETSKKPEWKKPYWFGLETDGLNTIRLCAMYGNGVQEHYDILGMQFNLTTGQPATEADYLAFNDIVGV